MAFFGAFLDVVFGHCCVHCGGAVEQGAGPRSLCGRCAAELPFIFGPACRTCGHPLAGLEVDGGLCVHCEKLDPAFGTGRSLVLLRGPARTLVHEIKYHGARHVFADLPGLFARMPGLGEYLEGACLVPVPLHPRKQRERGYNQSEVFARSAVAGSGRGEMRDLLVRVRDTATQTRLSREERSANLKNAFALSAPRGFYPGLCCVLVDDVFTTGSTLNACAQVLREAGCARVDALTFGHG